jgi:hypothetical protein
MSRILDFAKEIDNELNNLNHRNDYLENELSKEKNKNKKVTQLIMDFLTELKEVVDNE